MDEDILVEELFDASNRGPFRIMHASTIRKIRLPYLMTP